MKKAGSPPHDRHKGTDEVLHPVCFNNVLLKAGHPFLKGKAGDLFVTSFGRRGQVLEGVFFAHGGDAGQVTRPVFRRLRAREVGAWQVSQDFAYMARMKRWSEHQKATLLLYVLKRLGFKSPSVVKLVEEAEHDLRLQDRGYVNQFPNKVWKE